jgi:transposase
VKAPHRLEFTPEQIDALIERLNGHCLEEGDYSLLAEIIKAMTWLNFALQEKKLSIHRLRAIFGIKTETAQRLLKLAGQETESNDIDSSTTDEPASDQEGKKKNKGGHGHLPATEYTNATIITVAHGVLKKGSLCPSCGKGKLFNLSPGSVIHIKGQPWLKVEIYKPERLRCPVCGSIFTATLPSEIITESRADETAKAIVSLLKYRGGVPFYRQGQIQEMLGAPLSPSEIWAMTEDVADAMQPVYNVLCQCAADADVIHNDDTTARVLSIMKEREEAEGTSKEDKRKGTFTTCIVAQLQSIQAWIALFFTGRSHAGENLDELLDAREEPAAPIQQCDGGHNIPKNHTTQISNCLAHARRYFYELVSVWPKIVAKVIGWFSKIFLHDQQAPVDPEERLKWHQIKSKPIMEEMKQYLNDLLNRKEVEPNSSLGKAIAYFNNHWDGLTLFLHVAGVPLTNNICERGMKAAVLNRKNAYFYRNETGAKIGDILMSTIETCVLNKANPWDYLVAIQQYQGDVRENPEHWLPWNFRIRLNELRPP